MFTATQKNFSAAQEFIAAELKKFKLGDDAIFLAQLLFEENFLRLKKSRGDENFAVELEIRRRFGDVRLILRSTGEKFNPLENLTASANIDDEDYFNRVILKDNRSKIRYARKDNVNIISILVYETPVKQNYLTPTCIVLGICCGLLLKEFCSAEMLAFIDENILKSVREMFMNALMMMIPPLVFFSVMSGIIGMSNSTDIGRIGGKFALISVAKLFSLAVIGAWLSELLFRDGLPEILPAIQSSDEVQGATFSLRDMIVGIIPKNLVDPFSSGNVLEVLFLAIFFGTMMKRYGDRARDVENLILFLNRFCLDVMNVVMKFIPAVALISMIDVILSVGVGMLVSLGQLIFGSILGAAVILLVDGALVGLFCKLSPITFWQKNLNFSVIPFTLVSSNGCIPKTLKFCARKLGIDSKLAMFSIPVGIHLNRGNTAFYCAFMSVLMANTFGLEVDFQLLTTIAIASILISCAMPGVIIGLPAVFSVVGVPLEVVTIFVVIFAVLDMFDTTGNVLADISSTLLLAKSEDKVDLKILSE